MTTTLTYIISNKLKNDAKVKQAAKIKNKSKGILKAVNK